MKRCLINTLMTTIDTSSLTTNTTATSTTNDFNYNTVRLFSDLQPIYAYSQFNTCVKLTANDAEIIETIDNDNHYTYLHYPVVTLKLAHDKDTFAEYYHKVHYDSELSTILINTQIFYNDIENAYYIYIPIDTNSIRFETICRALVNENNGESYNCHNPDAIIKLQSQA